MKKTLLSIVCTLLLPFSAYAIEYSSTWQIAEEGDVVLNMANVVDADGSSIVYTDDGYWVGAYSNESNAEYVQEQVFTFPHFGGGTYFAGYVPCNSGDNTNHGTASQWGNMAGGGVPMTEDGLSVYLDDNGDVVAQQGDAYMLVYGTSEAGKDSDIWGTDTKITLSQSGTVKGMFVALHPSTYYSILYGDNWASAFSEDGDYFNIIAIGYKDNEETARVEIELAEYDNGLIAPTTWQWADLTELGEIDSFGIGFDGSDQSSGYINTPVYAVLDRIVFTPTSTQSGDDEPSTAIDEISEANSVVRVRSTLYNVPDNSTVYVYSIAGALIGQVKNASGVVDLPASAPAMIIQVVSPNGIQVLR